MYNRGSVYLCIGSEMKRRRGNLFRRMAKACFVWLLLTAWFAPTSAWAATYQVTDLSDWYFILDEETEITILGNSNESCSQMNNNSGTDPYLFLYDYDNNNTYLTEDDDANHPRGPSL